MLDEIKKTISPEEIIILSDEQLKSYIGRKVILYTNEIQKNVSLSEIEQISKDIFNQFRGLGILEDLLTDDSINEIMVNSYNQIFVERYGSLEKTEYSFKDKVEYERIIQKIVSDAGREVNISNPIVDTSLYDKSRANIIMPPISKDHPVLTIRKFSEKRIDVNELISLNTIDEESSDFLHKLILGKYNIVVAGGTSSGKTTFLNALSQFIPDNERIVTIEDSRELQIIDKENLISLQTRNSNNSNKGEITIKDIIKTSLRIRPDRLIVGEVRAEEALDMLTSMNTGHTGMTTIHSNSVIDTISRIETMVLRATNQIPIEAIKRMIFSAIEIIIYLKRVDETKRRVIEISELVKGNDESFKINVLYKYDYEKDKLIKIGKLLSDEKYSRVI